MILVLTGPIMVVRAGIFVVPAFMGTAMPIFVMTGMVGRMRAGMMTRMRAGVGPVLGHGIRRNEKTARQE